MKKILYITLGFIGVGFGTIGAVVPMIPTVPFLLLATIGFAKGSEKLHRWFVGTKLYKANLESYVEGRGMTNGTKFRIMGIVTVFMFFGVFMMFLKELFVPCGILFVVWILHILYFVFGVKTYVVKEVTA